MREAAEDQGEDPAEEEEHSGFVIAIMELLAVVTLVAMKATEWAGKLVLYGGDNCNVISWLDRRQAKHPVATFLLQVLSAIEATHSIRTQGAFLRTYHNITADALTRDDASKVMLESGLTPLEGAAEALQIYLERGWTRRALLWAGQADADRGQALRLAERRSLSTIPQGVSDDSKPLLDLSVLEIGASTPRYVLECLMRGAKCYGSVAGPEEVVAWKGRPLRSPSMLCCTVSGEGGRAIGDVRRGVLHARPSLVWLDAQTQTVAQKALKLLRDCSYEAKVVQVSGRTLKDQVWWRRLFWLRLWGRLNFRALMSLRNLAQRFRGSLMPFGSRKAMKKRLFQASSTLIPTCPTWEQLPPNQPALSNFVERKQAPAIIASWFLGSSTPQQPFVARAREAWPCSEAPQAARSGLVAGWETRTSGRCRSQSKSFSLVGGSAQVAGTDGSSVGWRSRNGTHHWRRQGGSVSAQVGRRDGEGTDAVAGQSSTARPRGPQRFDEPSWRT